MKRPYISMTKEQMLIAILKRFAEKPQLIDELIRRIKDEKAEDFPSLKEARGKKQ